MTYELHYWQGIPGRGEYVRLAFEAAEVAFTDTGAEPFPDGPTPPFAPPYLVHDGLTIGQTANILFYLGPRLGLAPAEEAGRLWINQIQLTVADFVLEIHDVHHPVGVGEFYENQQPEALRRAAAFHSERAPKFLRWFETVLARNPGGVDWLAGDALSYADLSLFHTLEGLHHAFPNLMARLAPHYPLVMALRDRVGALPAVAAYLASDRRRAFNTDGLFRHYPELDE